MALSDIIAKIDRDANDEAQRIRAEAREKADVILKQAQEEVNKIAHAAKNDAERAASKARGRIIAVATHAAVFAIQAFRASLIEKTFQETQELLSKVSPEVYRAFIAARATGAC